jgi:deoxyribodipyrimidine photo-lyase
LAKGIAWHELPNGGVQRGKATRQGWMQQWYRTMAAPQVPTPERDLLGQRLLAPPEAWQLERAGLELVSKGFAVQTPDPAMQPGGRTRGLQYADSFYDGRGRSYAWAISKPHEARRACSRLSPYLTFGCLSLREVVQQVQYQKRNMPPDWKRPLDALAERLRWREHFVQKFESEHEAEFRNYNRGFDLLPREANPNLIAAWEQGCTGYPMVDAAMRCVVATGYLNFRMRAMLVSFFCHILWQPWQEGVWWLGRQFLDYDIGIHIPQFQMQAGTVGIHTLRIYNPVKQGQDHDPAGAFVRQWVPELAHVPDAHVHEPWQLSDLDRQLYKAQDYPMPIVHWAEAYAHARDLLWKHKKHPAVQVEAKRLLARHTFGRQMN